MVLKEKLIKEIGDIVQELTGQELVVSLEHPEDVSHGDFATTVSFQLAKMLKVSPLAAGEKVKDALLAKHLPEVQDVTVVHPGFINIALTPNFFITGLRRVLSTDEVEKSSKLTNKRVMVEYAHPNTHKEMHIGHMRTLITGEALSRILESTGSKVFRANYQGDIGPHVAKALYGIKKIMEEEGLTIEKIRSWSNEEKAHFLGRGYARGSQEYEENKSTIDNINMQLYTNNPEIAAIYQETREWSLEYYREFYSKFGTTFDSLFFESQVVHSGRKIVEEYTGKVFVKDNGAIVFPGEQYGLHTRVFITQAGNPTYEGKEMGNAFAEHKAFPFDLKIHVVGSEQAGYFKVVFKALELIDPQKFKDKQFHLSMGMVQLTDRKMSSRTGDILRVDWLIDQVREKVEELATEGRIESDKKVELLSQISIGAVKYSVLKVGATQDVAFDINRSVSLEGDSGPYLQYAYARTQSVLRKAKSEKRKVKSEFDYLNLEKEELELLRMLSKFDEVVNESADKFAPNIICTYLYELASTFNIFYQKHPILKAEEKIGEFRLALTEGVGKRIKQGLNLLGIESPEKM